MIEILPFNRHLTADTSWRVIQLPSVGAGMIFSLSKLMRKGKYNGLKPTEKRMIFIKRFLPFNKPQTVDI